MMAFRDRGKLLCLAFAGMVAVVWFGHATIVDSVAANATVRVGYPQPSGAQLPLWVMSEAKLDKKYGVDLQNIYISGGARLTQTLVAGDIDMATTGGAVINAVLSGADLVYIALIVPTYGFSLYARLETKDVPSLKGKVVGVMTKGASSDHGLIALLRHNHLTPGQDVKFLYLGGVREALAALERGIVSAAVLSAPTTLLARRLGFKEVVNIATLNLPYVHNGLVTRRVMTRQQPERIKSFLRAYMASVKVSNEDPETSKRAWAFLGDQRCRRDRRSLSNVSRDISQGSLYYGR